MSYIGLSFIRPSTALCIYSKGSKCLSALTEVCILHIYLFEREHRGKWGGEGERENPQADSPQSVEPDTGSILGP